MSGPSSGRFRFVARHRALQEMRKLVSAEANSEDWGNKSGVSREMGAEMITKQRIELTQ